jgi:hypothetical protein
LPGDPNPAQYQPFNPETKQPLDGLFVIGWSRNASVGLVGVAKQDAERGMRVVNEYVAAREGFEPEVVQQKIERVLDKLEEKSVSFVTKEDVAVLDAREKEEAKARKTWEFKYSSDEDMLEIIAAPRAAAS